MPRRTPASTMRQRMEHAKNVIMLNKKGDKLEETDKSIAYEIAYLYRAALEDYTHESTLKTKAQTRLTNSTQGKKRTTLFSKVAKKADSLDIDYETYINGQFYWFHQWFHKYPKPPELIGMKGRYNCEWRAKQYLILLKTKRAIPVIQSPTLPAEKIPNEKLDTINQKLLYQLCGKWQRTEEQILSALSSEGIFDTEWLQRHHPQYC